MSFDNFDDEENPYAAPKTTDFGEGSDDWDEGDFEYASFLTRFAAAFLDGIIMNVIGFVMGFIAGLLMVPAGVDPSAGGPQLLLQLTGIVVNWLYVAGFNSSASMATPGKMACGIKVTDLDGRRISFGRATGRFFGKILSTLILLIGFLMQPFTARKQALHDILAGTLVVKS